MNTLLNRFIEYVKIDTTAIDDADIIPSFEGEFNLAVKLAGELGDMGIRDAVVDEHAFVFASVPASAGCESVPVIGLLAHLDTAPSCTGKDVRPSVCREYDGGIIKLETSGEINPAEYPELLKYVGDDIVVSDGTTLLGSDDKSGIAIIMDAVEKIINDNIPHGEIKIAFTPDEEVAVGGASIMDVENFGADFGITVDGDGIGELNYETFNGYSVKVRLKGYNIHTGDAKNRMINTSMLALEFDRLLGIDERPENTEGYEGFVFLEKMHTEVAEGYVDYCLRDFTESGMKEKRMRFSTVAETMNKKYGEGTVEIEEVYEYSNPENIISKKAPCLVELCGQAYRENGLEPKIVPIRGGTDGSTLAGKGLPCANIFMGGHNYHSVKEFVSVQAMEKASDILISIIKTIAINNSNKGSQTREVQRDRQDQ